MFLRHIALMRVIYRIGSDRTLKKSEFKSLFSSELEKVTEEFNEYCEYCDSQDCA